VAGIAQIAPAQTIGASYGDAFLAGLAANILKRDDLSTWVKPGYVLEPDPARHAQYESFYQQYLQLYENTCNIIHALNSE
jgi:xylulokinase